VPDLDPLLVEGDGTTALDAVLRADERRAELLTKERELLSSTPSLGDAGLEEEFLKNRKQGKAKRNRKGEKKKEQK
jgi:hypothetical protein